MPRESVPSTEPVFSREARNITAEVNEGTRVWTSTNPYEVACGSIYWARCREHRTSFHSADDAERDAWADAHDATFTHLFPVALK